MDVPQFEPAVPIKAGFGRFLALHPAIVAAVFALLHFVGLSIAVLFTQQTLSLDVLEEVAWSRDPQWVYAKHPPLPAWVMAAAMWASGHKPWAAALLGPLSSAVALFLVWRVASRIMDPSRALIAMFLLEGIIYFNFLSTEFNHNVILLPLWILIVSCAFRLYRGASVTGWALFGVAAALGMLGKYATLLLLAAVALAFASSREGRKRIAGWGPAIAVVCGLIVLAPHLYSLYRIDFAPFNYANGRLQTAASVFDRLRFPFGWLAAQLLNAGPAICMAAVLLLTCRRGCSGVEPLSSQLLDVRSGRYLKFYFILFAAPFVLCLGMQAVWGVRFHDMWGFPLFILFGVVIGLLTGGHPLRQDILPKFALAGIGMLSLSIAAIFSQGLGSAYVTGKGPRELYPSREITAAVKKEWDSLSGSAPLRYVVAGSWLGGIFATYHQDHPSVLLNGDFKESFWLSPSEISRSGAILVWDSARDRSKFLSACPNAITQGSLKFPFHTQAKVPPARVGWAILPPANSPAAKALVDRMSHEPAPARTGPGLGPAVTLLSSPPPDEQDGFVDEWNFDGGILVIRGWGFWQPELGAQMMMNTNLPVDRVSIRVIPRPDVVAVLKEPRLANSGFEVNLYLNTAKPVPETQKVCLWTEGPAFGAVRTHDWALCPPG